MPLARNVSTYEKQGQGKKGSPEVLDQTQPNLVKLDLGSTLRR